MSIRQIEKGGQHLDLFDTVAAERIESELDSFLEKRAREAKDAAAIEELWAEQERRHREKRQRELREEWRAFHEHMQALHASLCDEHRQKAAALSNGEGSEA